MTGHCVSCGEPLPPDREKFGTCSPLCEVYARIDMVQDEVKVLKKRVKQLEGCKYG